MSGTVVPTEKRKALKNEQRLILRQRLKALTTRERHDLQRRAQDLRNDSQRRSTDRGHWTTERWMLHLSEDRQGAHAIVIGIDRNGASIVTDSGEHRHIDATNLVVGDDVVVATNGGFEVLPRKTVLERNDPDPRKGRLLIAANVDVFVVVVSVSTPPLHPRLVDRYLAAISRGGADALICLNKTDLLSADELQAEREKLAPYAEMGIPVMVTSTLYGVGIEDIKAALSGKRSALIGHSGVGKSSLLNALLPETQATTASVSAKSSRGRHTTSASKLIKGDGFEIIDTPGIRELGIDFRSISEVAECFAEFPTGCRFANCTHLSEPGCQVQRAVREGAVSRARYESYRRLAQEIGGQKESDFFECRHCGNVVPLSGGGTKNRNHCPRCLHSLHLDHIPGDRSAACGGVMEPVAVWVRRDGEWAVIHRCGSCGSLSSNRIAADDNEVLLISMAVRPISQPPFPLDHQVITSRYPA